MQIVANKIEKNRSIFCWLPSLMTIKYPKGEAFVFAWGFYTLVLKDTDNKSLEPNKLLKCDNCGRIETEPYDIGDACYQLCGGTFYEN